MFLNRNVEDVVSPLKLSLLFFSFFCVKSIINQIGSSFFVKKFDCRFSNHLTARWFTECEIIENSLFCSYF